MLNAFFYGLQTSITLKMCYSKFNNNYELVIIIIFLVLLANDIPEF